MSTIANKTEKAKYNTYLNSSVLTKYYSRAIIYKIYLEFFPHGRSLKLHGLEIPTSYSILGDNISIWDTLLI